jgi:23S rRNA pseudouridine2605 synthase
MGENKGKDHSRPGLGAGSPPGAAAHESGTRIAKVIARAGLCSRREAEGWIAEGRVALNGAPATTPAVNVRAADKITVDGKPLMSRSRTRLFLFHKPRGLVATARDPQGRPTVFGYLREHWPDVPRVVSVGRLDINSEGLLLLTNDGGLARVLELPSTGWLRRYRVRANGETTQAALDGLREGVTIEGVHYAGIEAALDRVQGANCWLTMGLREGKNREIKRVLEHLGLRVNRLIRLSFGPLQLGDLAEGAVKEVPTRVLRDQLGTALAKAAGADFSIPPRAAKEAEANAAAATARGHAPRPLKGPRGARAEGPDQRTEGQGRGKARPAPRSRKHVSALRAESAKPAGFRKRIEHGNTADRSGRMIYVERLVAAASAEDRQAKKQAKRTPRGKPSAGRGGSAFKRPRSGERSSQAPGSSPHASASRRAPRPGNGGGRGRRGKS